MTPAAAAPAAAAAASVLAAASSAQPRHRAGPTRPSPGPSRRTSWAPYPWPWHARRLEVGDLLEGVEAHAVVRAAWLVRVGAGGVDDNAVCGVRRVGPEVPPALLGALVEEARLALIERRALLAVVHARLQRAPRRHVDDLERAEHHRPWRQVGAHGHLAVGHQQRRRAGGREPCLEAAREEDRVRVDLDDPLVLEDVARREELSPGRQVELGVGVGHQGHRLHVLPHEIADLLGLLAALAQ
eukprot:scaffold29064_cov51-Phaeocystis_antarctica.AAC.3